MFDEIYQAAFNNELEKIAINVKNRVITRGLRHNKELSGPIGTKLKKQKSIFSGIKSESSEGSKLIYKTKGFSQVLNKGIF